MLGKGIFVPAFMWIVIYYMEGENGTPNFIFLEITYLVTFLCCKILFNKMDLFSLIPEVIIFPVVFVAFHKIRYKVALIITILFHVPFVLSLHYFFKI